MSIYKITGFHIVATTYQKVLVVMCDSKEEAFTLHRSLSDYSISAKIEASKLLLIKLVIKGPKHKECVSIRRKIGNVLYTEELLLGRVQQLVFGYQSNQSGFQCTPKHQLQYQKT